MCPLMQSSRHLLRSSLLLTAGLVLSAWAGAWAAESNSTSGRAPAPSPTPAVGPKAVFVDDLFTGRDPFFPDSQRRRGVSQGASANLAVQPTGVWEHLQLKGISLNKERRLILINNATLAEGEKGPVKVDGQSIMLQCLEIRERSALVSIEGVKEAKEVRFAREP